MKQFIQQNGFLVYKESLAADIVVGSERMLALGGGIKARILKTKAGRSVVESFFFDRDRFDEKTAGNWVEKNMSRLNKSLEKVQESMPVGSFQDITLRVQTALNDSDIFSGYSDNSPYSYIMYAYSDHVVVSCGGDYYNVPYTDKNGMIELGEPVEVTMEFAVKEAQATRDKIERRNKPNTTLDEVFHKLRFNIKESTELDDTKREIPVVIIEAGKNFSKKRYYPKSTIQESATLYAGLKNFINHPTDEEERERPERDLKDWVSTITESWYDFETGSAMGVVHIHDDWLWKNIKDPVFRESIGLSINASGKSYMQEIDGQQMQVVERIFAPQSVDWVTEPGARGRVAYLKESKQKEREHDMLDKIKLQEFKTARPDLVQEIINESNAGLQVKIDAAVSAAVAPLNEKINGQKIKEAKEAGRVKISAQVNESKLPAPSKSRLIESLCAGVYEDDTKLAEAVKSAVAAELKYLTEVGGVKIGVEAGKETETNTKLSEGFVKRLGLKTEEVAS